MAHLIADLPIKMMMILSTENTDYQKVSRHVSHVKKKRCWSTKRV